MKSMHLPAAVRSLFLLRRGLPLWVAIGIASLAMPWAVAAEESLQLLSITPTGTDVPAERQIVLQFDRPVVPLGKMERSESEVPVKIKPKVECEWRWISTSALACQLSDETALVPATRYRVTVAAGLKAVDGSVLAKGVKHRFSTQRPTVRYGGFERWTAPGTPRIYVSLSQPMERESLARHLYFSTAETLRVPARVSLRQVSEDPRTTLLWVVEPRDDLPGGVAARLQVEPGLQSLVGPEPSNQEMVLLEFHTFPEFRFLGVFCFTNDGDKEHIAPGRSWSQKCNPLSRVWMSFTSPVIKEELLNALTIEPDLAGGRKDYDPWAGMRGYSWLGNTRSSAQEYHLYLPEVLQARTSYDLHLEAQAMKDEFGRSLVEDVGLTWMTDDRPSNLVLTHPVSVLEQQVETHVPLVVTNLDRLEVQSSRVTSKGTAESKEIVPIPEALNVAFAFPLKVRDWFEGGSGAALGWISAEPTLKNRKSHFFAQVTPFQVHAKVGHRSSLVWVTDMASGEPVQGAQVRIYRGRLNRFPQEEITLSEAKTNSEGIARLDGNNELDPWMKSRRWLGMPNSPQDENMLFVRVDHGGEMALLPVSQEFAVAARGANRTWIPAWQRQRHGHMKAWGTTAQGVYRVGEMVQFKIYVRDQDDFRFQSPQAGPYTLSVTDPTGKEVHRSEKITLDSFGSLHGEVALPKTAAVGWYDFELKAEFGTVMSWYPLRVLVADFTPAPFRVTADLSGRHFEAGDAVTVTTQAALHSGGPYAEGRTRITATVSPGQLPRSPQAPGYYFSLGDPRPVTVHQSEANLDQSGELSTEFALSDHGILYGRLSVEAAVQDDRGKRIAGSASASYSGRDRFVGLSQPSWILKGGESTDVLLVVRDAEGLLIPDVEIETKIEYRKTTASRVKGAGNAYITRYQHQWVETESCSTLSAQQPVACPFVPEGAGLYRMTASIRDSQGRPHSSFLTRWGTGKGPVLWETPPGNTLDILAEQSEYKVGETARFLIQNPYPGAQALLTIERLGVQKSWTRTFSESAEVVEIEITPDHLPGFYFSATVISPRVEAPPAAQGRPAGDVDLGKPTFKMGYVRVPVVDPAKEIEVSIKTDQEVYRPRDTVTVDLEAKPRIEREGDSTPLQLAVAVLDESVFDLVAGGSRYFDPYRGFYNLDSLDLANYNLLTRLIGIQKFEKKGANAGGGGGSGPELRSLFKFVSYWNPDVPVDENGHAQVSFQVPDNLTGWRVLVLAVSQQDLMGLGEGNFKVNQPIEIRSALPNQVVEGDQFEARFTVMNRTEEPQTLKVSAKVDGPAATEGLSGHTVEAKPYERKVVRFPVRAIRDGELRFTVQATGGKEGDALQRVLPVGKRASLITVADFGSTEGAEGTTPLLIPEKIRTDVGSLSVEVSPSVISGVEGAFEYMSDYPYVCWEQKLSKAVMASHYKELHDYLPDDLDWPGHQALPQETMAFAANYQAPNGGMVYYVAADRYVSPYLSAYTALAFSWLEERGVELPSTVVDRLDQYLLKMLRKDVFPTFYSKGMEASVRAVALAGLANRGKLSASDLERYRRHMPSMDLFGKAHFLTAAHAVGADSATTQEVRDAILAHANFSAGKAVFSESLDAGYSRILHSDERTSCSILSALVREQGEAPGGQAVGDIPLRLTRWISQARKRHDRWESTQDNIFCMNALVDFSQSYESTDPSFTARAKLDNESFGKARFTDRRQGATTLRRPLGPGDPGRKATVRVEKKGPGRMYYATRLAYAPLAEAEDPINAGMVVKREYSVERNGKWELLTSPFELARGELVRVDLFLSLPAARNFVVLDDPVPGGLEPVNRDLATTSTVDADKGAMRYSAASFWFSRRDWLGYNSSRWSFYHRELRHNAVRFYSEYLPAGNYYLSYTAQAIAPGSFQVLPLHAEEMYDPDVFGKGVSASLLVDEEATKAEQP